MTFRNPGQAALQALVLLVGLGFASGAAAQEPELPFMRHLFSPELVMQHQSAIGLGASQRDAISKEIRTVQAEVLEIQWQMHESVRQLEAAVEGDLPDAEAAIAAAGRIFELEGQVKLRHLRLLLFLKETLTSEQRSRLVALRDGAAQ